MVKPRPTSWSRSRSAASPLPPRPPAASGRTTRSTSSILLDLTILLDTPVDVGLARARKRGEPDRFESEKAQFFERVRCGYLEIAAAEPERVRVVDAAGPIAEVNLVVASLLEKILK